MTDQQPGSTGSGGNGRRDRPPPRPTPPPLPGRLPPRRNDAGPRSGPVAARPGAGRPAAAAPVATIPPPPPAHKLERATARAERSLARPALRDDQDPSLWPLAWLVALVLVPLAMFFQQYTLWLGSATLENAPLEVRASEVAQPPEVSALAINAKYLVKEMHFLQDGSAFGEWDVDEEGWEEEPAGGDFSDSEVLDVPDWGAEVVAQLEPDAVSRTERLRLAIVAGEVQGAEAALARLAALEEEVAAGGELAAELASLQKLYAEGAHTLDERAQRSLVARHGWFGELALSFNAPDADPLRWKVVSGYGRIAAFEIAAGLGMAGSFVLGIIAIIALGAIIGRHGLVLHFEPPEPGGSVYLEMFCVFVGGFVLLLSLFLFLFGLHAEGTTTAMVVMEIMTWGLFVAVLYPVLVAKMPIRRVLHDLGLHRGRGIFKEIACGLVGHIAGIPIIWFVTMIMYIVDLVAGGAQQEAQGLEGYPIFESPAGDTWLYVWIGAASTVIWAPVLEEIIFRGALYRHLRSRWRVPLAALACATIFGMVHPYTTAGMVQVAFSGAVFAALREWRGSLIAPMTAHALHNGTIMFVQVGVLWAIQ